MLSLMIKENCFLFAFFIQQCDDFIKFKSLPRTTIRKIFKYSKSKINLKTNIISTSFIGTNQLLKLRF